MWFIKWILFKIISIQNEACEEHLPKNCCGFINITLTQQFGAENEVIEIIFNSSLGAYATHIVHMRNKS